jgi:hypothetical protein
MLYVADFIHPVSWASGAETNFVERATPCKHRLTQSRFEIVKEHCRQEFATEFFRRFRAPSVCKFSWAQRHRRRLQT